MYPKTTGQTASLLGTADPHLNDFERRRKIDPPPPVVSGRRFWSPTHFQQASELLKRATTPRGKEVGRG